jgi:AraC-like DNA-binding protein
MVMVQVHAHAADALAAWCAVWSAARDDADLSMRTNRTSAGPAMRVATLAVMAEPVHLPWAQLPGFLPDAMWASARRSRELTPVMAQRYRGRHQASAPSWHDGWELLVVFAGRGVLEAGTTVPLGPSIACLIPPRLVHREVSDADMEVLWVGLAGSLLDDLPPRLLRFDQARDLGTLARQLWQCTERRASPVGVEMDGIARGLLGRVLATGSEMSARGPLPLDGSIEYLHRNYARDLSIGDLARRFGCSERHFTRVFRLHTGVAPLRYLRRLRIENARKLLAYTQYTIAEVAGLVGYADPAYFTRVFRQETGAPPTRHGRTRDDRARGTPDRSARQASPASRA